MMTPLGAVSVIIPAGGPGEFLWAALQSVMAQDVAVDEIVVVDDGMGDAAHAAVASAVSAGFPIRLLEGPRVGRPSAARNLGIAAASGEVITFLDDDDLLPAGSLRARLSYMQAHALAAVGGYVAQFSTWDERHQPDLPGQLQSSVVINLGAFCLRRSVFQSLGLLDDTLTYAEDIDFISRLVESDLACAILPVLSLLYRRHPRSMMASRPREASQDHLRCLLAAARRGKARDHAGRQLADLIVAEPLA